MAAAGVASVAEPATVDELRQVLRWHAADGHRVTVSGARTGVTGGAVPDPSTHLVSVARLRGVVALDLDADPPTCARWPARRCASCRRSSRRAAPGWTLPLDPDRGGRVGGRDGGDQRRRLAGLPLRRDARLGRRAHRGARLRTHARTPPRRRPRPTATRSPCRTATIAAPRICRRSPSRAPRTPSATASCRAATCSTSSSAARARSAWSAR